MFGALALLFAGLVGRSVYLQWIDNEFLQTQGSARHSRELEVPAHRGRIVDRSGEALALSTPVKSLWAFPDKFDATPAAAGASSRAFSRRRRRSSRRASARERRLRVPRAADRARDVGARDGAAHQGTARPERIPALLSGRRGDRAHRSASPAIATPGQEGIELAQQAWLAGVPGSRRVIINRRGEAVEDVAAIRAPQAGRDLALAIDSRLQYLAFRELKAAVELHKAKAGGLVILDVRTGEILALANWPTYNPNRRDKVARDRMRNRALTDVFEPGSTLKPFTIAAALDAGKIRPDTVIQTAPRLADDRPEHDPRRASREGALTVEQVIQKSSNVGAAKIALGCRRRRCGRCSPTRASARRRRPGFPGEVAGRLRPAKTWKPIEQATMAYGHGISVNLVQLARAYTMFATDGEVKPVTLFKTDGHVAGRPVLKPETALAVRQMLELATQPGGTAPKAQVIGYRVAGKTGTAHKLEGRGYTQQVRVVVRRLRAGVEAAAHRRGDDRRARRPASTTAAPSPRRCSRTSIGAALRMLGVPTDAPVNNVILPPDGSEIREET